MGYTVLRVDRISLENVVFGLGVGYIFEITGYRRIATPTAETNLGLIAEVENMLDRQAHLEH